MRGDVHKIVIQSPGGYDKLKLEDHPDPTPGPDQVLVRTESVGVNYADCCVRWGVYDSAKKFVGWPITPGFEFSGTIEARGEKVSRFAPGMRVLGVTLFGAYSSHVVVPSDQVEPLPARLDPVQAGGFPVIFLTAYHGMFQQVRVRPGMNILVHSAAGGVGSALVQLGRIAGCHVIGVVGSSHKVNAALENGAHSVIDKSSTDLWPEAKKQVPEGYDIIFDANGPSTLRGSYEHLRPTGKLMSYGFHSMLPRTGGHIRYVKAALGWLNLPRFNPLRLTNDNKSIIAFNLSFLFERKDLLREALADLLKWLEDGKIHSPQVSSFRMSEVAQAHAKLESGSSVGKLVLIPE